MIPPQLDPPLFPAQRLHREVRALRTFEGAREVQHSLIARPVPQ
jgi:alkylation response protein AidB-like acyl-CoA dehydrogenase